MRIPHAPTLFPSPPKALFPSLPLVHLYILIILSCCVRELYPFSPPFFLFIPPPLFSLNFSGSTGVCGSYSCFLLFFYPFSPPIRMWIKTTILIFHPFFLFPFSHLPFSSFPQEDKIVPGQIRYLFLSSPFFLFSPLLSSFFGSPRSGE